MAMSTNIISGIIAIFFAVLFLVSCESHEQKTDDAFEQVKEEKLLANNSDSIIKEIIEEPGKTALVKENGNPDEWTRFKMETERKILVNENKIKEIKAIPNTDAKLLRKIVSLEKSNNDLRKQMDEYNLEVKMKWENFKATMNHDVNEIGIELKDISINNKK